MKNKYLQSALLILLLIAAKGSWGQFNFSTYSGWDPNIPLEHIGDIEVADNGDVWVVNSNQIVRFDGVVWQVFDAGNTSIPMGSTNRLQSIGPDMWVATHGNGLFKLDAALNVTSFNTGNSGLLNDSIRMFETDDQGGMYILTNNELMYFDGSSTWTDVDLTGVSFSNAMAVDASNDLWLTQDEGPAQFTGGAWVLHDTLGACPNSSLGQVSANASGVYFGNTTGYFQYTGGMWSQIVGHSSYGLTSILADQFNMLWAANDDGNFPNTGHLYRFDGSTWVETCASASPFEPEYFIGDLEMSSNGELWTSVSRYLIVVTAPVSINEELLDRELLAFPNPFNETLFLELKGELVSVSVYDQSGSLVYYKTPRETDQLRLELKGLAAGMYTLEVLDAEGQYSRLKLVAE